MGLCQHQDDSILNASSLKQINMVYERLLILLSGIATNSNMTSLRTFISPLKSNSDVLDCVILI